MEGGGVIFNPQAKSKVILIQFPALPPFIFEIKPGPHNGDLMEP